MWERAGKDETPMVGLDMGWLCRTHLRHVLAFWSFIPKQIWASCACWQLLEPSKCGICPWDKAAAGQEAKFGLAQNTSTWDNFCCAQGTWRNFLSRFCPPFPCSWVGQRGAGTALLPGTTSASSTPMGKSPLPGMFSPPPTLSVAGWCFYSYQKEG